MNKTDLYARDISGAEWTKSSFSENETDMCVEVAFLDDGVVALRDSTSPAARTCGSPVGSGQRSPPECDAASSTVSGWSDRAAVGPGTSAQWPAKTRTAVRTHQVTRSVPAACGAEFVPLKLGLRGDRLSLPGWPPDPDLGMPSLRLGREPYGVTGVVGGV